MNPTLFGLYQSLLPISQECISSSMSELKFCQWRIYHTLSHDDGHEDEHDEMFLWFLILFAILDFLAEAINMQSL